MHRAAQHVERALRDIRGGDASGRAGGRRSPLRGAEDGHHPTRSKRCDWIGLGYAWDEDGFLFYLHRNVHS